MKAGLDELSTAITTFPSLVGNGMENELSKNNVADQWEKFQAFESFYERISSKKEVFFKLEIFYPRWWKTNKNRNYVCKFYHHQRNWTENVVSEKTMYYH